MAARYHALSVDHLEYLDSAAMALMKERGTTAVLLPGAFYYLREKQPPPVDHLRAHEIPIAVATDCNPGTSPMTSLPLAMNMACTLFRLTPEEAFLGVTRNAARALGIENDYGTLAVGKMADLAIWDLNHPASLSYYLGYSPLVQLVKHGLPVIGRHH